MEPRDDLFYFKHTCPIIDGQYEEMGIAVSSELVRIFGVADLAVLEAVLLAVYPSVERVRQTNIKMRDAANDQLAGIQKEIDELMEKFGKEEAHLHECIDLMALEMLDHGIESRYHRVMA